MLAVVFPALSDGRPTAVGRSDGRPTAVGRIFPSALTLVCGVNFSQPHRRRLCRRPLERPVLVESESESPDSKRLSSLMLYIAQHSTRQNFHMSVYILFPMKGFVAKRPSVNFLVAGSNVRPGFERKSLQAAATKHGTKYNDDRLRPLRF